MKKRLLTLLLSAVLAFSLAACGEAEPTGTTPSETASAGAEIKESSGKETAAPEPTQEPVSEPTLPPIPVTSEDMFRYEGDASTGITIQGLKDANSAPAELHIPDTIAGIPVVEIGERAFFYGDAYTRIILPDTIEKIGDQAFYGCSSLTDIKLSESLKTIGDSAFFQCSSLTGIEFPQSLKSIRDGAFYGCSSLTDVKFPEDLKMIGRVAFADCVNLETIDVPDSVTYIGESAFACGEKLTSVKIPGDAKLGGWILPIPFYLTNPDQLKFTVGEQTCPNLTDYFEAFMEQQYEAQQREEEQYVSGLEPTLEPIYDENAKIFDYEGNDQGGVFITGLKDKSITEVTIPDTIGGKPVVALINHNGWEGWSNTSITGITIPDSVTEIDDSVFYCCENLTSFTWKGNTYFSLNQFRNAFYAATNGDSFDDSRYRERYITFDDSFVYYKDFDPNTIAFINSDWRYEKNGDLSGKWIYTGDMDIELIYDEWGCPHWDGDGCIVMDAESYAGEGWWHDGSMVAVKVGEAWHVYGTAGWHFVKGFWCEY